MANRDMLINYVPGEECRIAIVEDGSLEEFYQERADAGSHVGNIYKGRIQNVEPSIQAAFVEFGLERNGFLHISDLHPMYFPGKDREEAERVGMRTPRRERPPIQKCLRRGQEILVQVLKEGIGTKGPTLTSYLSIPGRFLVMMPFMQRLGVSRKIDDDERRRAMRKILDELGPPEEFGFIIRTAGMDRTKTELKRDLAYLLRLWKAMERRRQETRIGELYTESDLIIRTIRDVYSSDIVRIIVDDADAAQRAGDFLAVASPRAGANVLYYRDPVPIFERYGVEKQIESIHAAEVPLPSGGSLVIESTEALVAIDVNSGRMRDNRDAETTAYKTNVEATDEICRQLRLRDLGGVVVNDLIDMRDLKHRRAIESRFRDNLKKDRARTRVQPISQFGILEMTRQRMRPSLHSSMSSGCPHCGGTGKVKGAQLVVLDVVRRLAVVLYRNDVAEVELVVSPDVAFQLLNRRRAQLVRLEQHYGKAVMVRVRQGGRLDAVDIEARDERGGRIDLDVGVTWGEPDLVPVDHKAAGRDSIDIEDQPEFDDEAGGDEFDARQQPAEAADASTDADKPRRPRRRRRRGKGATAQAPADEGGAPATQAADVAVTTDVTAAPVDRSDTPADTTTDKAAPPKRRRSRRRRGKGKADVPAAAGAEPASVQSRDAEPHSVLEDKGTGPSSDGGSDAPAAGGRRKRRRRRSRSSNGSAPTAGAANGSAPAAAGPVISGGYRNPRLHNPGSPTAGAPVAGA